MEFLAEAVDKRQVSLVRDHLLLYRQLPVLQVCQLVLQRPALHVSCGNFEGSRLKRLRQECVGEMRGEGFDER